MVEYIRLTFKISNEEDINKLVYLNNLIIKRIKILQSTNRPIPKAPIVQPELIKVEEILNESDSGVQGVRQDPPVE